MERDPVGYRPGRITIKLWLSVSSRETSPPYTFLPPLITSSHARTGHADQSLSCVTASPASPSLPASRALPALLCCFSLKLMVASQEGLRNEVANLVDLFESGFSLNLSASLIGGVWGASPHV